MDLGTILGLVAGIGIIVVGIIQSGGDLFWFYNFNSILIVLGGTLAATLVALPLKAVGNIFNILKMFTHNFFHITWSINITQ